MHRTVDWNNLFTLTSAQSRCQKSHLFTFLLVVSLLFLTTPLLHAASPTIMESPPRLAVESLAEIENNNPAFEMFLEPEFENRTIKTTGDGKYVVGVKDGWWHMYDIDGNQLIKPGKLKATILSKSLRRPLYNQPNFSDGYGTYKLLEGEKKRVIFIDIHGKQVMKKSFSFAMPFQNGTSVVKDDGRSWYIDTKGKALTPKYKKLYFNLNTDEPEFFSLDGKLFGLMDKNFKVIIKPQYQNVGGFIAGSELTSVQAKNGLWGYINKSGEMVIPPRYTYASSAFKNGLATVSLEPKGEDRSYFFIDEKGDPQFNNLKILNEATFDDTITAVVMRKDLETCPGEFKKNRRLFGAINTKGETVIPFVYNTIDYIRPGQRIKATYPKFEVQHGGRCKFRGLADRYLDREGNVLTSTKPSPKRVTPDTPFYAKLSIISGSTKIDGKNRYGFNYYVEGEEEINIIKPQFEYLKPFAGPLFMIRVRTADGTTDGMKEGLIKLSEVTDSGSNPHPKKAAVVHFLNTIKAKSNALANGPVVTEFDKLVAENDRLQAERKKIMAEIDAEGLRLSKLKTATYQPDISHLEAPWNHRKALGELHDKNNVRLRELLKTEEMQLYNAIAEFSGKLVSLMNQQKWDAADQLISSWNLSREFTY